MPHWLLKMEKLLQLAPILKFLQVLLKLIAKVNTFILLLSISMLIMEHRLSQRTGGGFTPGQQPQLATATKGPYGWNQAIKSDAEAYKVFAVDDAKAKPLREAGFGTVLSHVRDGIARGTGAVVTLANEKENLVILKERALLIIHSAKEVQLKAIRVL